MASRVFLIYDSGLFFQILEGEEKDVDTLFDNVKRDIRNKDIKLITKQKLEKRNFSEWTMKIKDISDLNDIALLPPGDIQQENLTPFYISLISNLLMGVLKDEYTEIQSAIAQHMEKAAANQNVKLFDSFSSREKQVLKLLVQGQTAKKIGRLLNISSKTVARHTENMCKKMQSPDKSDLIIKVFSNGYLNKILSFKN